MLSKESTDTDGTSIFELVYLDPTHSADVLLSLDLLGCIRGEECLRRYPWYRPLRHGRNYHNRTLLGGYHYERVQLPMAKRTTNKKTKHKERR